MASTRRNRAEAAGREAGRGPSWVERGSGLPLVLVPGIQGRWEWMQPAVEALARHFRVVTFSLAGERSSNCPFDPELGFDSFVAQIDCVLDQAGIDDAIVCGVSYGGLIASRYAGLRRDRVRELVLVSALAPGYATDRRVRFYARAPVLLSPLFGVGAWRRTRAELRAALPGWRERLAFAAQQVSRVASARMSPSLMVERMHLIERSELETAARQVTAPTLVLTGEASLDRTVPVSHTSTWSRLVPHARFATLDHTGHLGLVTRPDRFAQAIAEFVAEAEQHHRRDAAARAASAEPRNSSHA